MSIDPQEQQRLIQQPDPPPNLSSVLATPSQLPPCPGEYSIATWTNCFGEVTLPTLTKYVGEFKDGHYHGQGTLTHPDTEKYVGQFKDGDYDGQGALTDPRGRRFVGGFRAGAYNGEGSEYATNGSLLRSGIWVKGRFVSGQ